MEWLKWLRPGMGIKRWLVVVLVGTTAVSLGLGSLMWHWISLHSMPRAVWYLTLQSIPHPYRGLLFAAFGFAIVLIGLILLYRSLLAPFSPKRERLADSIYRHRRIKRGPEVVAVGGGAGLSVVLRGLKDYTERLTAIVPSCSPNSESAGLYADKLVQCILALADVEPIMAKLFQYRFGRGMAMDGHCFGEVLFQAMTSVAGGFEGGMRQLSRVLAMRGRILPSSLGQKSPDDPTACPEALQALLNADIIVIGPGDLYTSLLPNLLAYPLAKAIRVSSAVKIYVCNLATAPQDKPLPTVGDHIRVLHEHAGERLFKYVLANNLAIPAEQTTPVQVDKLQWAGITLVEADLIDTSNPSHHDPTKLARSLMSIYYQERSKSLRTLGRTISH